MPLLSETIFDSPSETSPKLDCKPQVASNQTWSVIPFFHFCFFFFFLFFLFFSFLFFFFSIPFLAFWLSQKNMKFLGQESDPSHNCDPHCSCCNVGSLIDCAGPGTEPASQLSREASDGSHCATAETPTLSSFWRLGYFIPWFKDSGIHRPLGAHR